MAHLSTSRITIDTKDIQILTGRSYWYVCKVMKEVWERTRRERHQLVSVYELCAHLSLPVDEAIEVLRLNEGR